MNIATCKEQFIRIRNAGFQGELNDALEMELRKQIVSVVRTTLESALKHELAESLATRTGIRPRRSGSYQRVVDTQYGRIPDLSVPKLRWGNKERQWQILQRYQRGMSSFLEFALNLYILGLSLRDLQEALYHMLGAVLSRSAINQITLDVQARLDEIRLEAITETPAFLIVDGVWVDIQYTLGTFKTDKAGHVREERKAQERVILTALAVYPDGRYETLHYEVAKAEDEASWTAFFDHLIARGLDPAAVRLVVSDGANGLVSAMEARLPETKQQRCITHKVRGMERYLKYRGVPTEDVGGKPVVTSTAKATRRHDIYRDAYAIYEATTEAAARINLAAFEEKWKPLEPAAVGNLKWSISRTFTFYSVEAHLHERIRTTNLLERLFREFRAKSDEIGAFPNETSCLTVFMLVVRRDHVKHNRSHSNQLPMAKNE